MFKLLTSYFRFTARHQPYMVRRNYHYEIASALTYPLAAALAEGAFAAVVAAKYFHASGMLIAVITAAPMFGNIMAILWAELSRDREKVAFVNGLQIGVIASIALVALTAFLPLAPGAWAFAGLIILARVFAAGIVTVRSTIWRYNYPRHLRGQVVGRINMIATAVLALTTFLGSRLLDHQPGAYIYLYLCAAVLGLIGVWQFSHVRVRRERTMLRQARLVTARPESMAQTDETNVMNYTPAERGGFLRMMSRSVQVLRDDPRFRLYQRWQMIAGFSFMMLQPPLVFLVSRKLTNPTSDYMLAIIVLQIIPLLTSILALPFWAPMFDRMLISKFRVIQGISWLTAQFLIFAGAYMASLPIIMAGQFVVGISIAAGNLVWNLGHNEFAPPEKSGEYMAVHVMLTGLRGFIAPFAGVYLYQLLGESAWLFAVTAALNLVSWIGYITMYVEDRRNPPKRAVTIKHA
ncbi:MAG: MFS transporter [Burkholderiales bacterium]|nr:MFS transporter [Phycisphaerae bacterium]